jgi:DNA topoisomerase-2
MKRKSKPVITNLKKTNNYTKIVFKPDLEKLNLEYISDDMLAIMKKRCLDLAALNNRVSITFNDEKFKFKSFEDYCNLYEHDDLFFSENENWSVGIAASNKGFNQVAFTNNTFNNLGGTHVEYIFDQIVNHLRPYIKKKHKLDVKPYEIRNNLFLFVNAKIVNNRFSSQIKEKLVTEQKNFGNYFEIPTSILNKISKSEIVQRIVDWKQTKLQLNEKAELRKLNKQISKLKVPNLIDCSSKDRQKCNLFIFEGMSASNGFLKYRNTLTDAAFLLKGKILNTYGLKLNKILQNKELSGLIASLGLSLTSSDISNLRYGKILITSDADTDGDNIVALLINFLVSYWPDLFKYNKVFRVLTPLMIIKDGKKQYDIYSNEQYKSFLIKNKNKNIKVAFKKGLGALSDTDYSKMMKTPNLLQLTLDDDYKISIENWFGKDSSKRKKLLLT